MRRLALLLVLASACGSEIHEDRRWDAELAINGLEDLDTGMYEAWLVSGSERRSVAKFSTGAGVTLATDQDPTLADRFEVTIEPTPDPDPAPSGAVILAGDLDARRGTLTFAMGAVTKPCGILVSDGGTGLYFELVVPSLPAGFVWEGWAVTSSGPISTGRFLDAGPPYPGRDLGFDVANGETIAVITIEPDLDGVDPTGDGPFALKPMAAPIPKGQPLDTFLALSLGPSAAAFATVTFEPR